MKAIYLLLIFLPSVALAVPAYMYDASGNPITSTGGALNIAGSISASAGGLTPFATARNVYSSTNVTTGAWVQLVASTASITNAIDLFDSSGQTLELGTGPAASETRLILIYPGGNGPQPIKIPASTRISIRAVSGTSSTGEIDLNLLN